MWNLTEFVYLGRLVLAVFCGLIIGYERKSRAKEAGIRTHCVVACASALMMVLSKYAYTDVMEMYGDLMKIDPSRIASGVVSGIGFLGAGMIFVHEKTVTGLTTAAGIWATSGIGMAIGAGMYILGICAALIIVFIQMILHLRPRPIHRKQKIEKEPMQSVIKAFEDSGFQILEQETEQEGEDRLYTITATLRGDSC